MCETSIPAPRLRFGDGRSSPNTYRRQIRTERFHVFSLGITGFGPMADLKPAAFAYAVRCTAKRFNKPRIPMLGRVTQSWSAEIGASVPPHTESRVVLPSQAPLRSTH
jgi:hypothetical protein